MNAVIATSAGAGRLVLAAQQLQDCRDRTNPYRDSWLPGAISNNLRWAADPCQKEQEAVDSLNEQSALAGNQVATQGLGGAPAPQLAEADGPVGNTDPAIPLNEFVVPQPGIASNWQPILPEDVLDMILMEYEEQEPPEDMLLDDLLNEMKYYLLWCPWGGRPKRNLKWKFTYNPKNSDWAGKWVP